MKKTFKEIRNFNGAATKFAQASPMNMQTKLGYAIKKVSEDSVAKATKGYQKAYTGSYYSNVESVQIDQALTDGATGAILLAPKGSDRPYMYDKEGWKAVLKAERDFNEEVAPKLLEEWDAKSFEIEPYYAAEVPRTISPDDVQAFCDFVIKADGVVPFADEVEAVKEEVLEEIK